MAAVVAGVAGPVPTPIGAGPRGLLDAPGRAGARLRRGPPVARAPARDPVPPPRADRARAGPLRPAAPLVPLSELRARADRAARRVPRRRHARRPARR